MTKNNCTNISLLKGNPMLIGLVVHGPEIVDSGYAAKIIEILENYGEVKARLGGTMGRTAVLDAQLEGIIDISQRLLPSQSINKFVEEGVDIIFLINYGKSSLTGHTFGFKVWNNCPVNTRLIQIERPGEDDGSLVAWSSDLEKFAVIIAKELNLEIINPSAIVNEINSKSCCTQENLKSYRKIAGVTAKENLFVNGIVVGKSTSNEVTIIAEDGIIIGINGGEIKGHGIQKLGKINLMKAIIKTGLLRKSVVKPRVLESPKKCNSSVNVALLNHAAEDIYKFKNMDMVVTVGDDTTLVAADILYRFNVPIIGITDGDLDKVVQKGFIAAGSMIVELESGCDDYVGEKILFELFNGKETMKIENIENFKNELIQIINNTTERYNIKYN